MKVAGTGIPFAETVVSLEATDFKERIVKMSGAGKVPVLLDGDVRIWESLAILEYLSEKFPATGLWPRDAAARGHARAIDRRRNACWLSTAAPPIADEHVASGAAAPARAGWLVGCCAH